MQNFTSFFEEKEITFTETGIRYNNEVFINYKDMRDISHRTDGNNALVFRYKDHLVRMPYNPDDKAEIMPYLSVAMQASRDAEKEEAERARLSLDTPEEANDFDLSQDDRFVYLDRAQAQQKMAEQQVEPPKKKSKKGLVIALLLVAAAVAAALIILL